MPWRAVLSLGWPGAGVGGDDVLRLIPAYDDVSGGRIGSQQLWDLNVSYAPSRHVKLTLGAMGLANTSRHFANVGAAGYDCLQWAPVGRRLMLTARLSL